MKAELARLIHRHKGHFVAYLSQNEADSSGVEYDPMIVCQRCRHIHMMNQPNCVGTTTLKLKTPPATDKQPESK